MNKIFLMIISGLLLLLLALDFIPIKFAKNLKDIQYSEDMYVCNYATATDGNWVTIPENNPYLSETIYLNVETNTNFRDFKEISNIRLGQPVLNDYIFYGDIEKREIDALNTHYWLQSTDWDIVYPVRRQSLRAFYAPRGYLTIYDFVWFNR